MSACPKCGGQMLKDYGEPDCIQCGYVTRPEPQLLAYLMKERNKKLWVNSHSKKRGKR